MLGSVAIGNAATRLPGFRSPSGNIECLVLPRGRAILCTLGSADYARRLQARCMAPSGAGVDWHGFMLAATGMGAISCSGGILYNPTTQRHVLVADQRRHLPQPFRSRADRLPSVVAGLVARLR